MGRKFSLETSLIRACCRPLRRSAMLKHNSAVRRRPQDPSRPWSVGRPDISARAEHCFPHVYLLGLFTSRVFVPIVLTHSSLRLRSHSLFPPFFFVFFVSSSLFFTHLPLILSTHTPNSLIALFFSPPFHLFIIRLILVPVYPRFSFFSFLTLLPRKILRIVRPRRYLPPRYSVFSTITSISIAPRQSESVLALVFAICSYAFLLVAYDIEFVYYSSTWYW